MLNVKRRVNVDAGGEQLLDIKITLRVAAPLRVGMGKLVDEDKFRSPPQNCIEVHLLEPSPFIGNAPARDALEPVKQRLRLLATMGLDHADDEINAFPPLRLRGQEHGVGLADARRRAQEYLEMAARFRPGLPEQGFGRRTAVTFRSIIHQNAARGPPNPAETWARSRKTHIKSRVGKIVRNIKLISFGDRCLAPKLTPGNLRLLQAASDDSKLGEVPERNAPRAVI